MTNLNNYTYWMTGDRLSIKITGENFMNTATKLTCRLTLSELEAEYFESAFIHFEDTDEIVCIFDIEPTTQPGMYYISVSNNDYQFVRLTKELELIPTIKIVNAWPNFFLMSDFSVDKVSHKIYIETLGMPFQDEASTPGGEGFTPMVPQCFFMPTTGHRSGLYDSTLGSLVVTATRLNDTDSLNNEVNKTESVRTFMTC
jgi:hypothetical protein